MSESRGRADPGHPPRGRESRGRAGLGPVTVDRSVQRASLVAFTTAGVASRIGMPIVVERALSTASAASATAPARLRAFASALRASCRGRGSAAAAMPFQAKTLTAHFGL